MWSGILGPWLFLQYTINYCIVLEIVDISVPRDSSLFQVLIRRVVTGIGCGHDNNVRLVVRVNQCAAGANV